MLPLPESLALVKLEGTPNLYTIHQPLNYFIARDISWEWMDLATRQTLGLYSAVHHTIAIKLPIRMDALIHTLVHEVMHACISTGRLQEGMLEEGLCELVGLFVMAQLVGDWRVSRNLCSNAMDYKESTDKMEHAFETKMGIALDKASTETLSQFIRQYAVTLLSH